MKVAVVALLAVAAVASAQLAPFQYGFAAYTYGPVTCSDNPCDVTPSCNHAAFKDDIAAYNQMAVESARINTVYSYGGDIEFWPVKDQPTACWTPAKEPACNVSIFYDPINAEAAYLYSTAFGVQNIVSLIDSRLDGWSMIERYNNYDACKFGNFYPDLNNLTSAELDLLAMQTAQLYCKDNLLSGVQIDLEPYVSPYTDSLDYFITQASTYFRDVDGKLGCRTSQYPGGRTVSYFTFAHSQHMYFTTDVLGANGYYVFSGYDLFPSNEDGGFMYNNVTEFGQKLRYEINFIRPVIGNVGRFTLAIPIAASCHEYEQYIPMHGDGCGPACVPQTNTALMQDYVQEAMNVLLDPELTQATGGLLCLNETAKSQFMGLSFWVWTHQMTYPPMKWFDNDFLPVTPSDNTLQILATNLPKFSDGTTCISQTDACTTSSGRPNGCTCDHSWECASDYCTGTCVNNPSSWAHTAPVAWTRMYGDPMQTPVLREHFAAKTQ